MFASVLVLGLVAAVSCQQPVDDGSYDAERYELPYAGETSETTRGASYSPVSYAPVQSALPRASYQADPRNAAILSEARYLSADGKFGASYTQEDGVQFKEEADPDGTRRGTYSYVDPSGQRKTVSYVAGKFGFQASGDHLPAAPAAAQPQLQAAPQPQYQAAPQYQPAPQPQYRAQPAPVYEQVSYEAAPAYQQPAAPAYQQPAAPAYQPAPRPQPVYRPTYKAQYRAEEPAQQLDVGPAHPTITQSTSNSYSISAAF